MQVVPTTYNGITYRSRTEARWANVFDLLGWLHDYEIEAFKLPCGRYLPDFYLPQFRTFFEVKAREPTVAECLKAEMLCMHTQCDVLVSTSPPRPERKEWDRDIISFNFWMIDDEPLVDIHRGGFVSRRRDEHPACSIHLGNLAHIGAMREIEWQTAFRIAANNRFGVFDLPK